MTTNVTVRGAKGSWFFRMKENDNEGKIRS